MRSRIASPIPGRAMCEMASAARVIRRMTAKQPTSPAAAPAPMERAMVLGSRLVGDIVGLLILIRVPLVGQAMVVVHMVADRFAVERLQALRREDGPRRPEARGRGRQAPAD